MQIVIEIDEEVKNRLCFGITYPKDIQAVCEALNNSIPLPKGHGRVIDYGYVVDAIDDWINAGEYNYTNATDHLRNRIRNVPTIIEKDGD